MGTDAGSYIFMGVDPSIEGGSDAGMVLCGYPVFRDEQVSVSEGGCFVLGLYMKDGSIAWSDGIYIPEDRGWDDFDHALTRALRWTRI